MVRRNGAQGYAGLFRTVRALHQGDTAQVVTGFQAVGTIAAATTEHEAEEADADASAADLKSWAAAGLV